MKEKEQNLQGIEHINKPESQEKNLEGLALKDATFNFLNFTLYLEEL